MLSRPRPRPDCGSDPEVGAKSGNDVKFMIESEDIVSSPNADIERSSAARSSVVLVLEGGVKVDESVGSNAPPRLKMHCESVTLVHWPETP